MNIQAYIDGLIAENAQLQDRVEELEREKSELINEMTRAVQVRDRSTLELILNGCLSRPTQPP